MGTALAQDDCESVSLRTPMEDYGWLLVQLVPLFGVDRIVLGQSGANVSLGVWNGHAGAAHRNHAMWVERDQAGGHYSLNALPETQRETVARHFIRDAKKAIWHG